MTDNNVAVIMCIRVSTWPECGKEYPGTKLQKVCSVCSEPVWIDAATIARTRELGMDDYVLHCDHCRPTQALGNLVIDPRQIDDLRAEGVADHQIAAMFAAAKVGRGEGVVATMDKVMAAGPDSELGREFVMALMEIMEMVMMRGRRN